jgi:type I restriction enzyme S subunit
MELKAEYKQTEIGIVPEDWELLRFAELFDFANGVNADKSAYGEGVKFINVLDVINHTHIRGTPVVGQVKLDKATRDSYAVRRGDILFNRTSETQEEVGLTSVYDDDALVVFGGFVIRGRPRTGTADARPRLMSMKATR